MKKEYLSPEWELTMFSFEDILAQGVDVSKNESGGNDHSDTDDDDW